MFWKKKDNSKIEIRQLQEVNKKLRNRLTAWEMGLKGIVASERNCEFNARLENGKVFANQTLSGVVKDIVSYWKHEVYSDVIVIEKTRVDRK